MTKPVWSHILALSAWTLKKAHIIICRKPEPRLHISEFKANSSFSSQTIPDCIRYIIGVFCYIFKSQMNILPS